MSSKKGRRTVKKALRLFSERGYSMDTVEKKHRYAKARDLFSEECDGFDIVGISPEEFLLIQVKTNKPATQKTYKEFAKKYGNDVVKVVVATWYDHKGWRIQWYRPDGKIIEEDLR